MIVEDNLGDVFLIREALSDAKVNATLEVVNDGHDATAFVDAADKDESLPCPDLIILDLNLPRKSGDEVLKHLRESPRCREALVLIVTTSDSPRDRDLVQRLGADAYFRKPSDYDEFMKLGQVIQSLLATRQA